MCKLIILFDWDTIRMHCILSLNLRMFKNNNPWVCRTKFLKKTDMFVWTNLLICTVLETGFFF